MVQNEKKNFNKSIEFSEEKYYGVGVYFRDVAIKSINRVIEELECEICILYLAHIPIQKMFTFSKNENIKYIPVKKLIVNSQEFSTNK